MRKLLECLYLTCLVRFLWRIYDISIKEAHVIFQALFSNGHIFAHCSPITAMLVSMLFLGCVHSTALLSL
jgi:hypothetical protein